MPAHNEANIIGKTLTKLIQQEVLASNIIMVADNCTDDTAKIANKLGVVVLERFNDVQRGKGFALDHGLQYLKKHETPDVVIILDADCEIDGSSLELLVEGCYQHQLPLQALYLMRNNTSASLTRRVAGFAWLVKNKIRPIAMQALGLPITLTGTGMAFPWQVIADIKVAHGNIVEDMQLGIDCTLAGFAPQFCIDAVVYSEFPEQAEAENTQRTRWEHGHLMTIFQQVPSLCKQAIIRKDWRLLGLALDLAVPPLSLLVLLSVAGLFLLAVYSYIVGVYSAFVVLLISFLFFTVMLIITWWKFGREYLTLKELCSIPIYVVSKISIYIRFLFKRQKSWIRTSRKAK
jgi:cellulose synthase/poly-beta-1,6-N-acetylglucosamine synthase-like glycosyltransferase